MVTGPITTIFVTGGSGYTHRRSSPSPPPSGTIDTAERRPPINLSTARLLGTIDDPRSSAGQRQPRRQQNQRRRLHKPADGLPQRRRLHHPGDCDRRGDQWRGHRDQLYRRLGLYFGTHRHDRQPPTGSLAVNYTYPNTTGTLTYTLPPNTYGTANITLTVTNSGGGRGRRKRSRSRSRTLTRRPVSCRSPPRPSSWSAPRASGTPGGHRRRPGRSPVQPQPGDGDGQGDRHRRCGQQHHRHQQRRRLHQRTDGHAHGRRLGREVRTRDGHGRAEQQRHGHRDPDHQSRRGLHHGPDRHDLRPAAGAVPQGHRHHQQHEPDRQRAGRLHAIPARPARSSTTSSRVPAAWR